MTANNRDPETLPVAPLELSLGKLDSLCHKRIDALLQEELPRRIRERDHTVWSQEPLSELTNRLGWLDLPRNTGKEIDAISEVVSQVRSDDLHSVVLLGMGGSSLAPEVFARVFGSRDGFPRLTVLDTTHPTAIARRLERLDVAHTLFVVSSKSGTTLETLSLFRACWQRTAAVSDQPGKHFVAITDPGSDLEELAEGRAFRHVFRAPPDVGGRYSALSVFGIVPACLIGIDVRSLLERAATMAHTASQPLSEANTGLQLGAILGESAEAGRNKVTFLTSTELESVPDWIEQLIAESTGKQEKGIVPVVGEKIRPVESYAHDRLFVVLKLADDPDRGIDENASSLAAAGHPVVTITLRDRLDLGAEMFRWEFATAVAGSVLQINPFDQPDVQLAKSLAKRAMAGDSGATDTTDRDVVSAFHRDQLSQALANWSTPQAGNYLAVLGFLPPDQPITDLLQKIRSRLGEKFGIATTFGYGPRFLHSTGQLHKGGPNNGLFVQFVDCPAADVPVPETEFGFRQLVSAQATGDSQALLQRGRRVLRINLENDVERGLREFLTVLG